MKWYAFASVFPSVMVGKFKEVFPQMCNIDII